MRNPSVLRRSRRRKRPSEYHHGDLRAAAVDVALAALDAGRPLPSLRDVSEACGVAHPALYRHFDNAEALMLSVAAASFRAFGAHVDAAVARESRPLVALRAGCEAAMRWGLAHRERYALMTGPDLAGKQHHEEFFAAASAAFGTLVREVNACGVRDPIPVAHTVMAATHGLVDLLRKGRTIPARAASVDDQLAATLDMVIAYVRSKAGR